MERLLYCKSEKEGEKSNKNVISQILLDNEALAVTRKYAALEIPDSIRSPRDGAGPLSSGRLGNRTASVPAKNGRNSHFSRVPASFAHCHRGLPRTDAGRSREPVGERDSSARCAGG